MKDLDQVIKSVIKDMDAGRAVSEIARKQNLPEGLVEEILQIYTTHQGIDIQGIIERLPDM